MNSDMKRKAAARGLDWADVREAYEVICEQEENKRAHSDMVRKSTWEMTTALEPHLGCYWRYGFANPWKRWPKLQERDYTVISDHDTLGQEVASHFPEYGDTDGTERLFGELLSEYDPMPSRDTMYEAAMDMLASYVSDDAIDAVPF
jgi:hypothetical protein